MKFSTIDLKVIDDSYGKYNYLEDRSKSINQDNLLIIIPNDLKGNDFREFVKMMYIDLRLVLNEPIGYSNALFLFTGLYGSEKENAEGIFNVRFQDVKNLFLDTVSKEDLIDLTRKYDKVEYSDSVIYLNFRKENTVMIEIISNDIDGFTKKEFSKLRNNKPFYTDLRFVVAMTMIASSICGFVLRVKYLNQ